MNSQTKQKPEPRLLSYGGDGSKISPWPMPIIALDHWPPNGCLCTWVFAPSFGSEDKPLVLKFKHRHCPYQLERAHNA